MLAADLHEGLAQELATLWLYMQTGKRLTEPNPDLVERCLKVVERGPSPAYERPAQPTLSEALKGLVSRITRENELEIALETGPSSTK